MKQESLDKALKVVVEAILNSDIEELDKIELAMNLMQFLNNYNNDVRELQMINCRKTR